MLHMRMKSAQRTLICYFSEFGPEFVVFGGSKQPPPTGKPIEKGGGLRPPPFPIGFPVGGRRLDPKNRFQDRILKNKKLRTSGCGGGGSPPDFMFIWASVDAAYFVCSHRIGRPSGRARYCRKAPRRNPYQNPIETSLKPY